MDFFRSQDIARRNTVKLVVLFALALLSLIAITNLLVMVVLGVVAESLPVNIPLFQRIDWHLFLWVSLAILGVVGFGSLYKIASLAGGGARVAELLQGKLLIPGGSNLSEQKILNVVEEMAIASGTPVPPVYLLEEQGINAFAAGYTPADAVIGITRGAIETLSRDELQGVIAHEFSHILHGDMRLNIRLIGILHGIMVLGVMGYYLLRSTGRARRSKKGGGEIAVVALGLMVIGYAGTFFGNLIKAAVSRQREFLADASAVQYTRNPDGIADALKRIGGAPQGSLLENPGASEISHALFSNGVRMSFSSLFATHPPLEQRIRRIQPQWDGNFDVSAKPARGPLESAGGAAASVQSKDSRGGVLSALLMTDALLAQAGNPQEADIQQARTLLARIPPPLLEAAHHPFSARALIYFLLLDKDQELAAVQMSHLQRLADAAVFGALQQLIAQQTPGQQPVVSPEIRLPLVCLCLPVLRQLSAEQYPPFRQSLQLLVQSDGKTSLWEWVLQRVVLQQLDAVFQPHSRFHHTAHHSLQQLAPQCAVMLGFLIHAGRQPEGGGGIAFAKACEKLELLNLVMPTTDGLSMETINAALDALITLKPLQKPAFLKACATAICADGVATVQELEIFRAIAAALDCPLPPLPLSLHEPGSR
ncbi:MAG: M48 family metallopeptidase [Pseudomonadota bacterium]